MLPHYPVPIHTTRHLAFRILILLDAHSDGNDDDDSDRNESRGDWQVTIEVGLRKWEWEGKNTRSKDGGWRVSF